jgi:hypothetical protein
VPRGTGHDAGRRPIGTSEEIKQLSRQYKIARDRRPTASTNEVVNMIMPEMSREHLLALAADWVGMTGTVGLDVQVTARGYVRNFVLAMDERDDDCV